jgi:hypothetical protein
LNRIVVFLAVVLIVFPHLAMGQTADEIRRATDGAFQIKKLLQNPDNFVLDSVVLAHAKHGNDICFAFHSKSAWDFVGKSFKGSLGEEIKTADITTKGRLRVWPAEQGQKWRPCSHQERYQITDITKEVREAGGFLP